MIREYFNLDQIKKMEEGLAKAPPATNRMSKADALRQLAPTLQDLRDVKGYTLEALVELLATQGLNVKVSTLQGALKKKGGKKKVKTSTGERVPGDVVKETADVTPAGMAVTKSHAKPRDKVA